MEVTPGSPTPPRPVRATGFPLPVIPFGRPPPGPPTADRIRHTETHSGQPGRRATTVGRREVSAGAGSPGRDQENPIQRPAAATVNQSTIESTPRRRLRAEVSSVRSAAMRPLTPKVKPRAKGRVDIFTQKEVL